MKKIYLLLFLISITVFTFSCKKENDNVVSNGQPKDTTKIVTIDTTFNNPDVLRLYTFIIKNAKNTLKSTKIDDSSICQYVKFVSYDSDDKITINDSSTSKGQRNIHEIEVFSNGIDIAINKYDIDCDTCVSCYANSVGDNGAFNANDGSIMSRWSSDRDDGKDTVFLELNLKREFKIDSILLYLGNYKQTYDLFITSADTTKWILVGSEKHTPIPVYIKN